MNVILVICYLLEVLKGSRTISYYIIFCILALLPFLVTVAEYKHNPESEKIKIMLPDRLWYFLLFYHFYNIFTGSICLFSAYSSIVNLLWQSPIECTLYVSNISCIILFRLYMAFSPIITHLNVCRILKSELHLIFCFLFI